MTGSRNGSHFCGGELVLRRELTNQHQQQGGDGQGTDDRHDPMSQPSLGTRRVEQDARHSAHRRTASRRDRLVNRTPTGKVRTTKPVAMIAKMT